MRGPRRSLVVLAVASVSLGVWTARPSAAHLPAQPGLVLLGTVATMDADATVLEGGVLVVGDRIAKAWEGSIPDAIPPNATIVTLPDDAVIFPGLINLHNHPLYAMEQAWPIPADHAQPEVGRPTGAEPYGNRYQWNTSQRYLDLVDGPREAIASAAPDGAGLRPEVILYAEIQSLLSGTTAMQGGQQTPSVDSIGARNVDNPDPSNADFSIDRVDTWVPTIGGDDFANRVAELQAEFASGALDTLIVHLAEGVPDADRRPEDVVSSRAELDQLTAFGLLSSATVVIHGTALGRADFDTMRAAPDPPARTGNRGASLVWSPTSNLRLYGMSTDVVEALAAGVNVALGTDWVPTGSPDLLVELKVADTVLSAADAFSVTDPGRAGLDVAAARDLALVRMVTSNAAQAVDWDDRVGSIEEGKIADLVVLGGQSRPAADSPYRRLIDATESDVVLTMVSGDVRAGDVDVMDQLKPGDAEAVSSVDGSVVKAVDVTPSSGGVAGSELSFGVVQTRLTEALATLPTPSELPPLFSVDDAVLWSIFDAEQAFEHPSVFHQVVDGDNRFAEEVFFDRWWVDDAVAPSTTAVPTTTRPPPTDVPAIIPPAPTTTPLANVVDQSAALDPSIPAPASISPGVAGTDADPTERAESSESGSGWFVAVGAILVIGAVVASIVLARRRRPG